MCNIAIKLCGIHFYIMNEVGFVRLLVRFCPVGFCPVGFSVWGFVRKFRYICMSSHNYVF